MESLLVPYAALCGITLMIGWLLHFTYKWMNPPCKGNLPPGTMGFPIIGETFQLIKKSPSIDIPSYYQQQLKRYGPMFKTSLLGQPLVVSMDPEVNRFVFQQEGRLFRMWFPEAGNLIFGKNTITAHSSATHKFMRSLLASRLFGPENLKGVMIRELEDAVKKSFAAWAAMPSIEVKDSVADMIFGVVAKKMIGMDPSESIELRKNFDMLALGMLCLPIYFPGTLFYKCMKAARNVHGRLTELLNDRLRTPGKKHGDFVDLMVEDLQSENPVIDENFVIEALAGILFGSFSGPSVTLSIALKLLSDNPAVVETLKEEHETILKKRQGMESGFTWEEYKSLTFTNHVINEITRMSNVAPGIFRKALKDVQVNGYTIPAGWLVIISPISVHLNPTLFEDPLKFNPWRWMTQDETKRITQKRNLIPFGGGIRLCLGAEFTKLFISIFLHVLVTKYRWIEIKGGEFERFAEMAIPQSYHIQLVPETK
ncbi:hypothetical protein ACP70R_003817 [Stipagrostis hirtigluma subsp. patula]